MKSEFEPVIGLEIHAELKTLTKMFCASLNDPNETHPNINICPVCMSHPGTLPVINREAVKKVIQVGLALHGKISEFSQFDRKNYFYPDLPKGYQISQYQFPLVKGGYLDIESPIGGGEKETRNKPQTINSSPPVKKLKRIRIQRIHLEEDTGRLIHVAGSPSTNSGRPATLVDFNRAGIPLMELVTEPDMHSASEARLCAEGLRSILLYLDASEANMEKGEMRIEANVSLRPAGSPTLGTKVELKNINSFRFVEQAIAYEIERQSNLLSRGEQVLHETRGWDERNNVTFSQRSKEEAHDYRYFPEPDLPGLKIAPSEVDELRRALPELPVEKLVRFQKEFGIDLNLAQTIIRDRRLAGFFETAVSELQEWLKSVKPGISNLQDALRLAANYLTTDAAKLLGDAGIPITESLLTPENFAELIAYLCEGKISSKAGKEVLKEMLSNGADPSVIIDERGLWQISEGDALSRSVDKIIAANAKAANDYKKGKNEALQFLLGQVMKETRGANPEAVRKILEEKLK